MKNRSTFNSSNRKGSTSKKPHGKNQNQNSQQKNRSHSKRNQEAQFWLNQSPETLTSHISILSRNQQGNNTPKSDTKNNGNGNGNPKNNRSKNRNDRTRSQFNKQASKHRTRNANGSKTERQAEQQTQTTTSAKSSLVTEKIADISAFDLFCAYHLGIGADNNYRPANINEVAKRFRADPATIKQALKAYNMDADALLNREFDMALGQLDIQVAPEGVDRFELAKGIYEEFLESPVIKRDWDKILAEDRKENQKVFRDN